MFHSGYTHSPKYLNQGKNTILLSAVTCVILDINLIIFARRYLNSRYIHKTFKRQLLYPSLNSLKSLRFNEIVPLGST